MHKVVIIGYGRFGKLLASILSDTHKITILETNKLTQKNVHDDGYTLGVPKDIPSADTIILAVPISYCKDALQDIAPYISQHHTVMDICSVKVYPVQWMQKYLPPCHIIATHPLFGPDSVTHNGGVHGLKMVLCNITASETVFSYWHNFWESCGTSVLITTPEEHDKDTVYSQAFTYTVARIVSHMDIPKLTFTTKSSEALTRIADYSANDTEQLFHDMIYYNPYSKDMLTQLKGTMSDVEKTVENILNDTKT